MKHAFSLLACAIGFAALSSPVWADDRAVITQLAGNGNQASIDQINSQGGNFADLYQGEGWYMGSGNSAQLMQQGVADSRISLHQDGNMNQFTVQQFDGRNLEARVNVDASMNGDLGGEGNMITILQSGMDSLAVVEQGSSFYNVAEIRQDGWGGGNMAEIIQSGNSNRASIYQSGSNLSASIRQSMGASGNTATIRQGF
jgi:hypothetical protein